MTLDVIFKNSSSIIHKDSGQKTSEINEKMSDFQILSFYWVINNSKICSHIYKNLDLLKKAFTFITSNPYTYL